MTKTLLLVALAVCATLLAVQSRALQSDLHETQKKLTSPHVGMAVPTLDLLGLDKQVLTIAPPDEAKPTVVFVFSPKCPYCIQSLPMVDRLQAQLEQKGAAMIGLSIVDAAQTSLFAKTNAFRFPVGVISDSLTADLLRVHAVPTFFVVGPDRRVKAVHLSALSTLEQVDHLVKAVVEAESTGLPSRSQ